MLFIDWHDGPTYTYKEKPIREPAPAEGKEEAEAKAGAEAGEEEIKADPEAATENAPATESPGTLEKKENDVNKGVLNLSDCNLVH